MLPNIIYLYYIMDLESIKEEVNRRINHSDKEKEDEYANEEKKTRDRYPQEGWHIPESYKNEMANLYEAKILEIRKDLNDDSGFVYLVSNLEDIKKIKARKESELEEATPPKPKKKSTFTKFFSSSGRTSSADTKIDDFYKMKKIKIEEISKLQKIIFDINTIRKIYNDDETKGGAKTKRRRNKKSKKVEKSKSKKSHRKSNRRRRA